MLHPKDLSFISQTWIIIRHMWQISIPILRNKRFLLSHYCQRKVLSSNFMRKISVTDSKPFWKTLRKASTGSHPWSYLNSNSNRLRQSHRLQVASVESAPSRRRSSFNQNLTKIRSVRRFRTLNRLRKRPGIWSESPIRYRLKSKRRKSMLTLRRWRRFNKSCLIWGWSMTFHHRLPSKRAAILLT